MATVFFKISPNQEKEIKKMMKAEGYTSKAEFFRFLIKFYKYKNTKTESELEILTKEMGDILRELDKQGKLDKSFEEQLEDL